MIFKKIDFLSPQITLYNKGDLIHSSIVSGIISLLSLLLIILCAVIYSLDLIQRQNPKAFYFNRYLNDAGNYPINSSSLFHFISTNINKRNSTNDQGFDFTKYRIIGINSNLQEFQYDKNINKYDHWIYGLCNNNSDTKGISHLITQDYFTKSACIRKFYNSLEQKYYETNHPNFKWPEMAHGTCSPENKFYYIFIDRCKEDYLNEILGNNYHCKKDISFSEFEVIHFNFIVQYVDVLNYKNPNDKFFYRIETKIEKDNYSVNHLNFFPSLVKTNKGIIFDNYQEEISYVYDRDDVFTYTYDKNEIYMSYYLWLNNKMCYFERIYKKIQDVLSDIGGVSGAITFIAAYLNKLYNDYVILSDIKLLLSPYFNTEDDKKKNNNISFKNLNYKSNNIESSKTVVDIGMNSEKNKNTIPSESNIQNTENNKVL